MIRSSEKLDVIPCSLRKGGMKPWEDVKPWSLREGGMKPWEDIEQVFVMG